MKKNYKGMTLIEVVVAMAVFGISSAMLFTAMNYAIQASKKNKLRSEEMYTQAVNVGQYNSNDPTLNVSNTPVSGYKGLGTDNKFNLKATFVGGAILESEAYAYQAKRTDRVAGVDNSSYQLKFFETNFTAAKPDPANQVYWVTFFNCDSADFNYYAVSNGGKFFNTDNFSTGSSIDVFTLGAGGKKEFGVVTQGLSDPNNWIAFAINEDCFAAGGTPGFKVFTQTEFESFYELDALGNPTGYVNIYYMGTDPMGQGIFQNTAP